MVIQTVATLVMLKERHLAHLSDEMMVSQKALLSDYLMERNLAHLLARWKVTQTALLMAKHSADLSDEMMAL